MTLAILDARDKEYVVVAVGTDLIATYVQQAILAAQAVLAAGVAEGVFESIAAGLAATVDGEYFWVADSGGVILYRNAGGSEVEVTSLLTDGSLVGYATLAALASTLGAAMIGTADGGTLQDTADQIYIPDQTLYPETLAYGSGLRNLAGPNVNNSLAVGPGVLDALTGVSLNANPNGGYGMTAVGTKIAPNARNPHDCVFMGYETAVRWEDGYNCVAIGAKALYDAEDPQDGVAIGVTAGYNITGNTSYQFSLIGTDCAREATTVRTSNLHGHNAGQYLTVVHQSNALGWRSLGGLVNSGSTFITDDNAIGYRALGSIQDGTDNNAMGTDSLVSLENGNRNDAHGKSCLANIVDTNDNAGFGYNNGTLYTGSQYAGFGSEAFTVNVSGVRLAGIGYRFARQSTGGDIAGAGWDTLPDLTSGGRQVAVGNQAGDGITTNDRGVWLGHFTGATGNYADVVALGDSAIVTKSNQFMFGDAAKTFEYVFNGYTIGKVYTVATLPAAAAAGAGARAFVSDANATTFASTVAGGGANKVPVFSDGTNWLIG